MRNSLIQEGVITDVRYVELGSGKACEVKAATDGRTTNWLPVKSKVSSFYKEHIPPRVDDQVIIFNPNGKDEDGFVDTNIAYEQIPLPSDINENTIVRWAKDGTQYTHDVEKREIVLKTPCNVHVESLQDITLKATKIILDSEVVITKNLEVLKKIKDEKGTVTDHEHDVEDHLKAVKRP